MTAPLADTPDVRTIALAMPGVEERDHHGFPSFRVGGKIFCTLRPPTARMMVKLDPEDQRNLIEGYPAIVSSVGGSWGAKGSTFVETDLAGEALTRRLLDMAWTRATAKTRRRSP